MKEGKKNDKEQKSRDEEQKIQEEERAMHHSSSFVPPKRRRKNGVWLRNHAVEGKNWKKRSCHLVKSKLR